MKQNGDEAAMEAAEETNPDRRRHKRVPVRLSGRYMLDDGTEHPCECMDISVGGVKLRAAQSGPWGSKVIAYIDDIGRLEGYIVRRAPGWFAMAMRITQRKGERVHERIAAILQAEAAHIGDRRDEGREWSHRKVWLFASDGRRFEALLTDLSKGGAAVLTEAALEIGERVRLDNRRAKVARLFPGGAALKFEKGEEAGRLEAGARARRA